MAKNFLFFVVFIITIELLQLSIQQLQIMPAKLNLMFYVQLSIVLISIWRNITSSQLLLQLKSIHRLFQDYLRRTRHKKTFIINGVK